MDLLLKVFLLAIYCDVFECRSFATLAGEADLKLASDMTPASAVERPSGVDGFHHSEEQYRCGNTSIGFWSGSLCLATKQAVPALRESMISHSFEVPGRAMETFRSVGSHTARAMKRGTCAHSEWHRRFSQWGTAGRDFTMGMSQEQSTEMPAPSTVYTSKVDLVSSCSLCSPFWTAVLFLLVAIPLCARMPVLQFCVFVARQILARDLQSQIRDFATIALTVVAVFILPHYVVVLAILGGFTANCFCSCADAETGKLPKWVIFMV